MKIQYISSFSVGNTHEMINRSLLDMLCKLNPYSIQCHVTKSAKPFLQNAKFNERIKCWHTYPLFTGKGSISLMLRYLMSAGINLYTLLRSNKDDILFYNFNNVFSLRLINSINKLLKRDIIICCHGELEYLTNSSKHNKIYKRVFTKLTCNFFSKNNHTPSDKIRFIVFGDVIKDNLKPLLSNELYSLFHSIDHPVESKTTSTVKASDHKTIRLGTVGILNQYKGSDIYPLIAERFRDNEAIKFFAVGQIQCNPTPLINAGIVLPKSYIGPLEMDEFTKMVSDLDYILLLYPTDTYRLIASGAMLDALRFHRPLIALETEYFRYIFDKYGEFGYLASDENELIEIIENISTLSRTFEFDKISTQLTSEALIEDMRSVFNSIM